MPHSRSVAAHNKRILVLGKYYPPHFGGVELVTKQCAEALADQHDVIVLCHNTGSGTIVEDCESVVVVRCSTPFAPFRQPVSLAMAYRLIASRADLIHFHAPNFWAAALISLLKPSADLVITHHADVEGRDFLRRLLIPLYWHLLRRAKTVFVSSVKNIDTSRDLRCDRRKIQAIPFGLDSGIFIRKDTDDKAETNHAVVFGFCGRLVWYKGLDLLIEAFGRIEGDCRLIIIGDGPLRGSLEAMIRRARLADRVVLTGRVSEPEKIRLLQGLDVFVLPSTHVTETFGLVQVEAQMCGIPCISSRLPTGVSDVIEDGVSGILVEPNNVADLLRAMSRMMRDTDFRTECGRQSRARAHRLFSEIVFKEAFRNAIETIEPGRASDYDKAEMHVENEEYSPRASSDHHAS